MMQVNVPEMTILDLNTYDIEHMIWSIYSARINERSLCYRGLSDMTGKNFLPRNAGVQIKVRKDLSIDFVN